MTDVQFEQLINTVEGLSNGSQWGEFWISLFSAIIGGLIAYWIAWYQVNKSSEQEGKYREQDIARQKLFMIDELKLKSTETLLGLTTSANSNINNTTDLGLEKHATYLRIRGVNYSRNSTEMTDINKSLAQNLDEFQNYLSDLFTFVNLFDIEEKFIDIENLKNEYIKLYNKSQNADLHYSKFDEDGDLSLPFDLSIEKGKCIQAVNKIDSIVRDKQIKLITSMRGK